MTKQEDDDDAEKRVSMCLISKYALENTSYLYCTYVRSNGGDLHTPESCMYCMYILHM